MSEVIISEVKQIVIPRTSEANFDKACEAALRQSFSVFDIDEDCHSKSGFIKGGYKFERCSDSVVVEFKKLNMCAGYMGREFSYIFETWIERCEDE